MKKFIVIGPCRMDIIMPEISAPGAPITWMPGSPLQNAAILLARKGLPTWMVSEAARDAVGDLLCHTLESQGVNIQSIDRISNGESTSSAVFIGHSAPTIYTSAPDGRFDASWPRIDPGDVVLFGSPALITPRTHQFMSDLLDHIADRKAIAVYAPLLTPHEVPRITRATPVILELLERTDIAVLTPRDTMMLFSDTDATKCYREHVRFYCRTMVYCNEATHTLSIHHNDLIAQAPVKQPSHTVMWQAGLLASLASSLHSLDINPADNEAAPLSSEQLQALAALSANGADTAADSAETNH